jgi:hypothetical protein
MMAVIATAPRGALNSHGSRFFQQCNDGFGHAAIALGIGMDRVGLLIALVQHIGDFGN